MILNADSTQKKMKEGNGRKEYGKTDIYKISKKYTKLKVNWMIL